MHCFALGEHVCMSYLRVPTELESWWEDVFKETYIVGLAQRGQQLLPSVLPKWQIVPWEFATPSVRLSCWLVYS